MNMIRGNLFFILSFVLLGEQFCLGQIPTLNERTTGEKLKTPPMEFTLFNFYNLTQDQFIQSPYMFRVHVQKNPLNPRIDEFEIFSTEMILLEGNASHTMNLENGSLNPGNDAIYRISLNNADVDGVYATAWPGRYSHH